MANSNRKRHAPTNSTTSWIDKLTVLTSPTHQGTSTSQVRHKGKVVIEQGTELKSVGDEGWCIIEKPGMDSNSFTTATDGNGSAENTPVSSRKKLQKPSPNLSQRSSSVSATRSSKLTGPGSPSSLQRRASGRTSKPSNLDVTQNGKSSIRSVSPGRALNGSRSGSPSNKSSRATASPVTTPTPDHQGHALTSGQQNGGTHKSMDLRGDESSLASKIRDTLRISRPKRKKGSKGKGLAYSVTPVEINPSKYNDPFETSYAENYDEKLGQGHDFKAASIPHNKPEYCDHCGETAWGLYRQVLKCSKCDFIVHRKCEQKVVIDCSSRLEQSVLQHDKQVEDIASIAATENKEEEEADGELSPLPVVVLRNHTSHQLSSNSSLSSDSRQDTDQTDSGPPTTMSTSSNTATSYINSQILLEKTKLSRKIREYNRKTTPVHHIHLRSSHNDPTLIEYQGFVRVHMCVQRPIHVSTAITRTSWYRLMRPVKERSADNMNDGFETAFYLPTDTNRLVHIINTTTTKELVSILLKKFCVTDNPKKFSLYEEYGSDSRRLFEEDHPLEIVLDGCCAHRNSKLVLRDNTYSTIQWDAFTLPELTNFIQILEREEDIYISKMEGRFKTWRMCISQALKDSCMVDVSKQTMLNVASSKTHSISPKTLSKSNSKPEGHHKRANSPVVKVK